ncbi:MAG: lipopolysaccharide heptosyltransferase family protein, partial [Betaproteobacteria bacterium]|nr:lipopolysaccharide heptosyltransferase family protein [Betaproteobacteria bacterium]
MRVLVVKRDKLGDLLLTTPVLAHVKSVRPDIELHLLANDYNAWVAID